MTFETAAPVDQFVGFDLGLIAFPLQNPSTASVGGQCRGTILQAYRHQELDLPHPAAPIAVLIFAQSSTSILPSGPCGHDLARSISLPSSDARAQTQTPDLRHGCDDLCHTAINGALWRSVRHGCFQYKKNGRTARCNFPVGRGWKPHAAVDDLYRVRVVSLQEGKQSHDRLPRCWIS